ncbi:MAG: phosphate/phosphite/phosphonate ABC transporter substrate-binding protein [Gammaproteobacteria bacterium]
MNKYLRKQAMAFMVITLIVFSDVTVSIADDILRIGIFPRRSVASTTEMFTPLSNYLGEQLGRKVSIDVPPDMPAFWSRISNGEYDLVHLNQYHYVRANAEFGWQAILKNEEFGKDKIAGALWVLKDSSITQLSDLKGKLIVFGGGDHAMVASIMTRDILLQAGIREDSFIGMSTLHPVKSVVSVYYNQADAAGVGESIINLPAIRKKIDVSKLRVLAKSKSLAHLPWAVSGKMDKKEKEKIIASLLLLNDTRDGRSILKAAGLSGIRVAQDSDYDEHRLIIKRVLGEDYVNVAKKLNKPDVTE